MCLVGRALQEEVPGIGISQTRGSNPTLTPLCLPLAGCGTWGGFCLSRPRFPPLSNGGKGASLMSCSEESMRKCLLSPERGRIWCSLHVGCCHPRQRRSYSVSTAEGVGSPAPELPGGNWIQSQIAAEQPGPLHRHWTCPWATTGLNPSSASD